MTVILTPTDIYPADFNAAADGDNVSQATRVTVMQEYADALNHFRNRIPGTGTAPTITVPLINMLINGAAGVGIVNTEWAWDPGGLTGTPAAHWQQRNVASAHPIYIGLDLEFIHGRTLTGWALRCHGGLIGGHAGWPVAIAPTAGILKSNPATGADGESNRLGAGLITDPAVAVSQAAYEQLHTFGETGLTEVIDSTTQYMLEVIGEEGANAEINEFGFFNLDLTFA